MYDVSLRMINQSCGTIHERKNSILIQPKAETCRLRISVLDSVSKSEIRIAVFGNKTNTRPSIGARYCPILSHHSPVL